MDRRMFLKGAGAIAIGLPLLEYNHGKAWGREGTPAKRLITTFEHGGTISCASRGGTKEDGTGEHHGWDDWAPLDPGESLVLGPIHKPLESVRDYCLVLRGVDNMATTKRAPYGGDHGYANVTALTAADFSVIDKDTSSMGPSIDHVIATRLAERNPVAFKSLNLMVPGHQYGTPFFTGPKAEASSETDPVAVFKALFSGFTPSGMPDPELTRIRNNKKSVLDGVMSGLGIVRKKVGRADLAIIDAHTEHLRELEKRIELLAAQPVCTLPTGFEGKTVGQTLRADVRGNLHVDLILAALRCGLTNVATLQIADIITNWLPTPYGPVAFDIGHSLHHLAREVGPKGPEAANAAKWREEMQINRAWRMSLLQRLAEGLKATPEGAGNMLDNSLILHTSEFSDGAVHSSADIPLLLIGKAGNYFRTGRHLNYNDKAVADPKTRLYSTTASTHNVFTSVLHAFGYEDPHFGNDAATVKGALPRLV
jgi:hypothetical protein